MQNLQINMQKFRKKYGYKNTHNIMQNTQDTQKNICTKIRTKYAKKDTEHTKIRSFPVLSVFLQEYAEYAKNTQNTQHLGIKNNTQNTHSPPC